MLTWHLCLYSLAVPDRLLWHMVIAVLIRPNGQDGWGLSYLTCGRLQSFYDFFLYNNIKLHQMYFWGELLLGYFVGSSFLCITSYSAVETMKLVKFREILKQNRLKNYCSIVLEYNKTSMSKKVITIEIF